jgi:ABC-2 type transport system ATP-binding protein
MADPLALDLHDVAKVFRGRIHALRGVNMQVHAGEIFGLLGPNGAGKSTLVKIMMTVVRPTRCRGTMLGNAVGHKPTLAKVGYLPEHHRFPRYLTGRQTLEFYAALSGISRPARHRRATELLETVGMSDWQHKKVTSYSKGMMQRIGLAQALMHNPDLIVLDEPTDGVDPVGRREIRDILLQLRASGKTIFLNSHLLSELEMVCDRVAILVQGAVVQQGTLDELTRESQRYELVIAGRPPRRIRDDRFVEIAVESDERSTLVLRTTDPARVQPVIDMLRIDEATIVSIRPARESLEDLFMRAVVDPETGTTFAPGARREPGRRARG